MAAVLVVTALAFAPALRNPFVSWDDLTYIRDNPLIRHLSLEGVARLFHIDTFISSNYHPLTILSYAIEYHFAQLDPFLYHLDNILLHVGTTVLVCAFVLLLEFPWPVAAATSMLFALHPTRVESVAWAAERKDVLSVFFALLSLVWYAVHLRRVRIGARSVAPLAASLLFFLLSLLSKAQTAALPLIMLLADRFCGRRGVLRLVIEKVPFLACSAAFGILALRAQAASLSPERLATFGTLERLVIAAHATSRYLVKLVAPFSLSAFYPYPPRLDAAFFLMPALLFSVLLAAMAITRRRSGPRAQAWSRTALFGGGFFFVAILPVSQILPVGDALLADRYAYLAFLGPILALAHGGFLLAQRSPKLQLLAIVVAVVVGLGSAALSRQRTLLWRDDITVWSDALTKYPSSRAYHVRGMAHLDRGSYAEALRDLDRSLEMDPSDAMTWSDRGVVQHKLGRHDLAARDFGRAMELNRVLVAAYSGRGILRVDLGDFAGAREDFVEALRLAPSSPQAFYNMGYLKRRLGDREGALASYSASIAAMPDYADALSNRAILYYELAKDPATASASVRAYLRLAAEDFSAVLRVRPLDGNALAGRSASKFRLGDMAGARADAARARSLGYPLAAGYVRQLERNTER